MSTERTEDTMSAVGELVVPSLNVLRHAFVFAGRGALFLAETVLPTKALSGGAPEGNSPLDTYLSLVDEPTEGVGYAA